LNPNFLSFFEIDGQEPVIKNNFFYFSQNKFPVINGIPRFTSDASYVANNFGKLREKHATLQLDSKNETSDRRKTILGRTKWPSHFFKNKAILECGCGAGPDTEILLSLGARVIAVDMAGVDIAKKNIGINDNVQFIQASILDLPLKMKSFDIVFCHRVLQHTPNPAETLSYLLKFVKENGAVFIHSYSPGLKKINPWKYALRPITTRMSPEILYKLIKLYAKPAYRVTNLLNRKKFGRTFVKKFIPFRNHKLHPYLSEKNDDFLIEYGIHDTFDSLSPMFDNPIEPDTMEQIAKNNLKQPYEIIKTPTITLLRTIITH